VKEPSPQDVDWIIGNGCMMSREGLETVGIFDEALFQVNEDVDCCTRARRAGYRCVHVASAAVHYRGVSSADLIQPIVACCAG
jgi:GT2 family glycosyltransferase